MILKFSKFYPWKDETFFAHRIQAGVKIHTIRSIGKCKVGDKLQFLECYKKEETEVENEFFLRNKNHASNWIAEEDRDKMIREYPLCAATEKVLFTFPQLLRHKKWRSFPDEIEMKVQIEDFFLTNDILNLLAANDGMGVYDLARWFFREAAQRKTHRLEKEIIHWTDQRYTY